MIRLGARLTVRFIVLLALANPAQAGLDLGYKAAQHGPAKRPDKLERKPTITIADTYDEDDDDSKEWTADLKEWLPDSEPK